MASFNKVILMGRLTRDPETRVTASGLTICKLGLACSRAYATKDGERKEETTFIDVDAFGKQAEVITKYMRKGRPLMVEGRLKLDQWESNDGQKRSKLGVVLETFQFLGNREDSPPVDSGNSYERSAPPARGQDSAPNSTSVTESDAFDDDVPF
jgi:single-strand DNA-binding protein